MNKIFIFSKTKLHIFDINLYKISNSGLRPIVLIPGICGSKLMVRNRQTNNINYSFGDASFTPGTLWGCGSESLWGKYNSETKLFESFINDYADVYAKPGIAGCDYLLENQTINKVLGSNLFDNAPFLKYYGLIISQLKKKFGYEADVDLFAYTYDYRQQLNHSSILDGFHQLLTDIQQKCGKSAIVIAHSQGGMMVEVFLRMHDDWSDLIHHIIGMGVPYEGAGAYAPQSFVHGYALQMGVPDLAGKGGQCQSGGGIYLCCRPATMLRNTALVFVKQDINPSKIITSEDILASDFKLHPDVYGPSDIPDVSFLVLQRMLYESYELKFHKFDTLKRLARGSKPGAIEIILPDFEKGVPTQEDLDRKDFRWRVFQTWDGLDIIRPEVNTDSIEAEIAAINTTNIVKTKHFINHPAVVADEYLSSLLLQQNEEPEPSNIKRPSPLSRLVSHSQQRSKSAASSVTYKVNEYVELERPKLPWLPESEYRHQSLCDLIDEVHGQPNSIDNYLFSAARDQWLIIQQTRNMKINFSNCTQPKYTGIVGSGKQTPLHLVFSKPVEQLSELLHQPPNYIYGVGDSTVMLNSALADPFPSELVHDRIVFSGVGHFQLLHDAQVRQELFDVISLYQ